MDKNISTVKERILHIAKIKRVAKKTLCENIGMTYGNFKSEAKKTPLNSDAIANLFSLYPDVNLEWIIAGKGEPLKDILSDFQMKDGGVHKFLMDEIKTLSGEKRILEEENQYLHEEVRLFREENKLLSHQIAQLTEHFPAGSDILRRIAAEAEDEYTARKAKSLKQPRKRKE